MMNGRLNEFKQVCETDIERREKYISSLKGIGKNYKYKKNGGEFTDVRKTLDGVDGIAKVERVTEKSWDRNARAKFKFWQIITTSDTYFDIDTEYPSIADIEASIEKAITENEKCIAIDQKTLDALDGMIAECDGMVQQIAAIVPEDTEGEGFTGSSYNLMRIMKDYLKHELDDMFQKKFTSFWATQAKKTA